jgi:hypothetical protein
MTQKELDDALTSDLAEDLEYADKGSTWGCLFWSILLLAAMFFAGCFDFVGIWLGRF